MMKSLSQLCMLLNLAIFGTVCASTGKQKSYTPANRDSEASKQLKIAILNYDFSHSLKVLNKWWEKRYKGMDLRIDPQSYFYFYEYDTSDGPTPYGEKWMYFGFCDDSIDKSASNRSRKVVGGVKRPEKFPYYKYLHVYLEHFLWRQNTPMYLPRTYGCYTDGGEMEVEREVYKDDVNNISRIISRTLYRWEFNNIKLRALNVKDEMFALVLKSMGMELPGYSGFTSRDTYKFTNDGAFVDEIFDFAFSISDRAKRKTSLFMLSLFLTLLFRRMEDGNKFVFDSSEESRNSFFNDDDGSRRPYTESVKWNAENLKIKNDNGKYIGLTGIPAKYSAVLKETVDELNPPTFWFYNGVSNTVYNNLIKGGVSIDTIMAEFSFFWRVYYEIGSVLKDRTFSSYTWAIFSFYDDFIYRISEHEDSADKLPKPERKKKRTLINMHLVKYVALHMRMLRVLTLDHSYQSNFEPLMRGAKIITECSIQ
ncbi:hypothetical protein PAEPH01_0210 [Pancytospora epiphaga]|nr:hypothetical protein PAEPH01_0210 [Pancytospora epiphaga]